MLRRLRIQNLAIVSKVDLELGPGLNVLTGETGAGKSIVLDALLFLGGARVSPSDVRVGATHGSVEATLDVSDQRFEALLEERGIVLEDGQLTLRRVIAADGKSRALMNDQNVTASFLQACAPYWLDITGQHGQHLLRDPQVQLEIVDEFADLHARRKAYETAYQETLEIHRRLEELQDLQRRQAQERDFESYQLRELESTQLKAGELENLIAEVGRAANAEKLATGSRHCKEIIDADGGLYDMLGRLQKELSYLVKLDPSLQSTQTTLTTLQDLLKEIDIQVSRFEQSLDIEESLLEAMNSRLAELQAVARKYGSIDLAIERYEELRQKQSAIESLPLDIERCSSELGVSLLRLSELDRQLQSERETAAKRLSEDVEDELRHLGMTHAHLELVFSPMEGGALIHEGRCYGPLGSKRLSFLFSANPGVPLLALDKVASGGEFSRVLLAIKALSIRSRRFTDVKVYVFDEVDSGIGGPTAERVGLRMKALSRKGQVLCVTHLAQVACFADHHFRVEKHLESGTTHTHVELLAPKHRVLELARMIGGLELSPKVKAHAEELYQRGLSV